MLEGAVAVNDPARGLAFELTSCALLAAELVLLRVLRVLREGPPEVTLGSSESVEARWDFGCAEGVLAPLPEPVLSSELAAAAVAGAASTGDVLTVEMLDPGRASIQRCCVHKAVPLSCPVAGLVHW